VGQAVQYIERLGQVREVPAVDLEAMRAVRQEAEDAMWAQVPGVEHDRSLRDQ